MKAHNQQLNRTLAGFARHPNIGAYLIVGLGCETGQASFLADSEHLVQIAVPGHEKAPLPLVLNKPTGSCKQIQAISTRSASTRAAISAAGPRNAARSSWSDTGSDVGLLCRMW